MPVKSVSSATQPVPEGEVKNN